MAENINQIDYQYYEPTVGFNPLTVPDYAGAVRKKHQEDLNKVKEAMESEVARDKTVVAAAEARARDMNQLAELSQTLFKQVTDIAKTQQEIKEIDDTFEALFGNVPVSPQEQKEVEDAAAINEVNNQAAIQVQEETGDAGVANFVRNETPAGVVSRNFRSSRARLIAAQTDYQPFLTSYLNSDAVISVGGQSVPVRVAVRSGDAAMVQAAIAQGRAQFVRTYGIHQANRAQAVSMLQGVITNVDAQLSAGFINQGIKEQREEDQRQIVSQSFLVGQNTDASELGNSFQNLANQAWTSGAYDSRADANRAVVTGILNGLADRGDTDAIDAFAGTLQVPNQPGTQLINTYAPEFAQARNNAEKNQTAILSQGVRDVKATMFEQLSSATTKEQKDQIIENAAIALEAQGSYEEARALRQQRDNLVVDGGADYNAAQLENGIRNGEITTAQQIEEQRLLGNISDTDANNLTRMLSVSNGANKPEDKVAASITDDYVDAAQSDILQAIGLQKDQFGNITVVSNDSKFSAGDGEIIVGQVARDIYTLVNDVIRANPGITNDPVRLQQLLGKELRAWRQENLLSDSGKFSITGFLASQTGKDSQASQDALERNVKNFQTLLREPDRMAVPVIPQSSRAQPMNLISQVGVNGLTDAQARNFNPLRQDVLFTRDVVQRFREQMAEGKTDSFLASVADSVGLSPLALLTQQSNVYGLGRVPQPQFKGTDARTPVEGAKLLMSIGFPARSAAWLSGSIEQESSWLGQRKPWGAVYNPTTGQMDGSTGNFGLLSWATFPGDRARVSRIEKFLGKPINQASDLEQVNAIKYELKNFYPESWRILSNPMASDRQLMRALKLYIGWGHTGRRFEVARQVESQL